MNTTESTSGMSTAWLELLYAHGRWANGRILDTVTELSEEQLRTPIGFGYDSVMQTLVHIAGVQSTWLRRCQGISPRDVWDQAQFPTLAALRARWEIVEADTAAYLATLSQRDLDATVTFVTRGGEPRTQSRWEILLVQATHALHHRAEIALAATGARHSPGDIDLFPYMLQHSNRPA